MTREEWAEEWRHRLDERIGLLMADDPDMTEAEAIVIASEIIEVWKSREREALREVQRG